MPGRSRARTLDDSAVTVWHAYPGWDLAAADTFCHVALQYSAGRACGWSTSTAGARLWRGLNGTATITLSTSSAVL